MRNGIRRAGLALAATFLAALAPSIASAADLGISAGAWSFAAKNYEEAGISPGLYAKGGAIAGLAPWLEMELFGVAEAAPSPFRDCFLGAEASLPLTGSRDKNYFNAFVSVGFLQAFDSYEGKLGSSYISVRLTPLAIGNPFFGRRDRMFSIGALYELGGGSISLVWSVMAFDFFAASAKH